ncbi:hypothetical protein GUI43_03955 [Micromonospora noduli]|uniref:Peptidase inhibitor family I36 n=2 Tax=Micromonospora noduli TaxID=709876 RepID=A0A328N4L7_9ACTN|nr:hypothetical protein LAH08_02621 [Micromonospora noduli]RAO08503.1 hypothetical protein GUI43_03955 [Micromonospora noduli]RAO11252.1 hypothetical protein LUPAC07_04994 [Micromonospora noduli]RAO15167.1 hypothetical protein MED15_04202 [Micromonospora noduli]RAO31391.1 hypothetical protein ONO86_05348 [Micromonospora noduli]
MFMVTPAQATTAYGCAYPGICYYQYHESWVGHDPDARYVDTYYQRLSSSAYDPNYVYNSRNDDGVLLYAAIDGGGSRTFCLFPNQYYRVTGETVYAMDIKDAPNCAY